MYKYENNARAYTYNIKSLTAEEPSAKAAGTYTQIEICSLQ